MIPKKKIILVAGARPNYMKIFPVWRVLKNHLQLEPIIVHTGQHYSHAMSDVFFKEFGLPEPNYCLNVGSASHAVQTARIMVEIEKVLNEVQPALVVVVGDVNSTVAAALVSVKLHIPVAHVEAGLRSFDRDMPEEINRLATDAISDYLLTSCIDADENLKNEGVSLEKIFPVGNLMIDTRKLLSDAIESSTILTRLDLKSESYICVTLHRPSNVDQPEHLIELMDALAELSKQQPVVFPLHPRVANVLQKLGRLDEYKKSMVLMDPLGYKDFQKLVAHARIVITDSGGIQEETSYLGIPCLTVRPNTERPVTVREGSNQLVEPTEKALLTAAQKALQRPVRKPCTIEQWDGKTAERITAVFEKVLFSGNV